MAAAKLELVFSKKRIGKAKEEIVAAVVDLEKSKEYPINYVCMLPKTIDESKTSPSKFVEIFGEKSVQVAIELLSKALKSESDVIIKDQIEKRLAALQSKPKPTSRCAVCGCVFEPRRYGPYVQVACWKCRGK